MDATQLLLSAAVTITTVLLILVGLQLISLLKHYKVSLKSGNVEKKPQSLPANGKKEKPVHKSVNLATLLGKIKILTPTVHSTKRKFFKSS